MDEAEIKDMISKKRQYEAEYQFLCDLLGKTARDDENIVREASKVQSKLARIKLWLALLPEDEASVITRHLIDGIDVPRIVLEYEQKWGREFAKTERTIKMYQKRALQRIMEFEVRMQSIEKGVIE